MTKPILIVLAVVALFVLYIINLFNSLIRLRNRAEESWADIETQLKRRYDLIPNLINTVKGYASHETTVFENVTKARSMAMNGGGANANHAQAENMLTDALKSIFAVAEAYPDLKANTNFLELQRELAETENKIQSARRFYNGNVLNLNNSLQMFPGNVFAKMFNFTTKQFFDIEDNGPESKPVEVKF